MQMLQSDSVSGASSVLRALRSSKDMRCGKVSWSGFLSIAIWNKGRQRVSNKKELNKIFIVLWLTVHIIQYGV